MGSSGFAIELKAIRGRTPASRTAAEDVTRVFLQTTWVNALVSRYAKFACGWIAVGEDSLLTLEAEPDEKCPDQAKRILFVFYDSVTWSYELAQHWVELALSYERKTLEQMLDRAGYALTGGRLGSAETIRGNFFMQGTRVAHAQEGGVFWQFPECASQDYTDLGPRIRARAEAARDHRAPCGCPLCASLRSRAERMAHASRKRKKAGNRRKA